MAKTTKTVINFRMTKDQIQNAIGSISRRGKQLDLDIHKCAVSIAHHVNVHHEVSLVNNLIDAMPAGARVNALRQWFVTFAKVVYCEESKSFLPKRAEAHDLELAESTPWFDLKKEPEFKPLDSQKLIDQLFATLTKASKGERASEHAIDPKHLAALAQVASKK